MYFQLVALLCLGVHLCTTTSLVSHEHSHWFIEPRTGQDHYLRDMSNFEEIELGHISHLDEDRLVASRRHNSWAHNPKVIGVILGIALCILIVLIYIVVERFKHNQE
jgi:hypothetical protein